MQDFSSSTTHTKQSNHGVYAFKAIESKWQNFFETTNNAQKAETGSGERHYILEMLPYPSGKLHMGHVRNYSIGDAIARFKRLKGGSVLHPMGWDAFGLPAENAAMQNGAHPSDWTIQNIAEMKRQLKMLGFSYNWDREIATCMPSYYAHQQKVFKQFLEKGLMERKESWVNWDPEEQSVLANEQVINGRGWRSNAIVEKRLLSQWSCKITSYAEELLNDLSTLTGWPEKVVKMQENWIGRSEGATVRFRLLPQTDANKTILKDILDVSVFTTRPDTLFGCAFVAIAPTHPIAAALSADHKDIADFISKCQKMMATEEALSTAEKEGMDTQVRVQHPFDSSKSVPLYIANFVLMEYGTGAVFGCPAHDERDFEFATKYNLPLYPVMEGDVPLPHIGEGIICHSDFLNGLTSKDAKRVAIDRLVDLGCGESKVTYRLRDWLVSRQRYWGCPIPIIYCDNCGVVPVPDQDLPVELPSDVTFDKPGNPLEHHPTWKHVNCPKCGKTARRETDTLDTFFDSSWYFLRYICADNQDVPVDVAKANMWAPVEWYIGGIEHAVLHLLYARFFTKVLRDLGYINFSEPFTNLLTQGMVCHETYQDEKGQWLYPEEVIKNDQGQWVVTKTGQKAIVGSAIKMSKSKKNLVDPLEILASYGADVARLFVMSDTPPEKDFDWNTEALEGCWRYLNRVSRLLDLCHDHLKNLSSDQHDENNEILPIAHQALQKITDAYHKNAFNKVIAYHRELCRSIEDHYACARKEDLSKALEFFILTIAPIAPHLAYEYFEKIFGKVIDDVQLPDADPMLARAKAITIAVQVNGKMRGTFDCEPDQDEDTMVNLASNVGTVIPHLEGKTVRKIIIVPNRLVNIIVG